VVLLKGKLRVAGDAVRIRSERLHERLDLDPDMLIPRHTTMNLARKYSALHFQIPGAHWQSLSAQLRRTQFRTPLVLISCWGGN
jgi:hypothetical protein